MCSSEAVAMFSDTGKGLTMLGGATRAFAAVTAGKQEESSSLAAASMARAQSDAVMRRGEFEEARIRREGRRLIGRQTAVAAATGADPSSGSALANTMGTARVTETDALTARNNAFLEAQGLNQLRKNYKQQARGARYAGFSQGIGHLLSAYGTVYESKPKGPPQLFGGG